MVYCAFIPSFVAPLGALRGADRRWRAPSLFSGVGGIAALGGAAPFHGVTTCGRRLTTAASSQVVRGRATE
jgi:hypothetical protein